MNDTGYDKERALFPADVRSAGCAIPTRTGGQGHQTGVQGRRQTGTQLLDLLQKVLDLPLANGGGTLNVLRNRVLTSVRQVRDVRIPPESTLNAKRNTDHAWQVLRVMRRLRFSTADNRSVDLSFLRQRLPVATAELSTLPSRLRGRDPQYRATRLPKRSEDRAGAASVPIGVLVHFAVSTMKCG